MFFLSGLFVWNSLQRKGAGAFVRDRARRLGLPFVAASAVLAPLAYYPAYLTTASHTGVARFWQQWRSLGYRPAGPAWFIWVLLAFDCAAAALFLVLPNWGEVVGRMSAGANRRPALFFGFLVAVSAIAYIPMAVRFTAFDWASWGPFFFQTSRIIHYFVYFMLGAGVGAIGIGKGLLAPDGKLARRWPLWAVASLIAFGVASAVTIAALAPHPSQHLWEVAADCGFVLSCAASSFAFLALFLRFAKKRSKIWDTLTANAYGIYLLHYAFVSWLQCSLLKAALPAIAKGSLVLTGAVALSWAVTAALRRIPAVARVI
jgi:peptidoglycan/LPS O-acetylase OafA/YrhL